MLFLLFSSPFDKLKAGERRVDYEINCSFIKLKIMKKEILMIIIGFLILATYLFFSYWCFECEHGGY